MQLKTAGHLALLTGIWHPLLRLNVVSRRSWVLFCLVALFFSSACQDSRGLGWSQACSQQSPTGAWDHTVRCLHDRGKPTQKISTLIVDFLLFSLLNKSVVRSSRWYTTTAMAVLGSPFTEGVLRRQRGFSVRLWNRSANVIKLACSLKSSGSDMGFSSKIQHQHSCCFKKS